MSAIPQYRALCQDCLVVFGWATEHERQEAMETDDACGGCPACNGQLCDCADCMSPDLVASLVEEPSVPSVPVSEVITWVAVVDQLPDADLTVLMFHGGEEVSTGFLDGADWRYAESGGLCPLVSHWADLPKGPAA